MPGAASFFADQILREILTKTCKIVLKMTWLGEIGNIYRDLLENLRKDMKLRSKIC